MTDLMRLGPAVRTDRQLNSLQLPYCQSVQKFRAQSRDAWREVSAAGHTGSQHSPCGYPFDKTGTRGTAVEKFYCQETKRLVVRATLLLCRLS